MEDEEEVESSRAWLPGEVKVESRRAEERPSRRKGHENRPTVGAFSAIGQLDNRQEQRWQEEASWLQVDSGPANVWLASENPEQVGVMASGTVVKDGGVHEGEQESWLLAGHEMLKRGVAQGVEHIMRGIAGVSLPEEDGASRHLTLARSTCAAAQKAEPGHMSTMLAPLSSPDQRSGFLTRSPPSITERLAGAAAHLESDDNRPLGLPPGSASKRRLFLKSDAAAGGYGHWGTAAEYTSADPGRPLTALHSERVYSRYGGFLSKGRGPQTLDSLQVPRSPFLVVPQDCSRREATLVQKRMLRLSMAVERGDLADVRDILPTVQGFSDRKGTALQRTVHLSLHALMLKLTGTAIAYLEKRPKWKPRDMSRAMTWLMRTHPLPSLVGVAMSGMILHKMLGRRSVHIIDMGQSMLPQWPFFVKLLASQPGRPLRHLRISWLDTTLMVNPWRDQFAGLEKGVEVSQGIRAAADAAGVAFTFEHVPLRKGNLDILYNIRRRPQDTFIYTVALDLMFYKVETHMQLLQWMKMMQPETVAVVELDLATASSSMLLRFRAIFDYYLLAFTSYDACCRPEETTTKLLLEDVYWVRMMIRLVSCEDSDRVCQPAGVKVWTQHFQSAGFVREPLSSSLLDAASEVIKRFPSGFGLSLTDATLSLTWHGNPLAFAFSWTA